jgi:hypothetical protein
VRQKAHSCTGLLSQFHPSPSRTVHPTNGSRAHGLATDPPTPTCRPGAEQPAAGNEAFSGSLLVLGSPLQHLSSANPGKDTNHKQHGVRPVDDAALIVYPLRWRWVTFSTLGHFRFLSFLRFPWVCRRCQVFIYEVSKEKLLFPCLLFYYFLVALGFELRASAARATPPALFDLFFQIGSLAFAQGQPRTLILL